MRALRGFTLVELLVVIAIMGLLGTAAVGGYRQMQRGMEERGVFENVNRFMRSAYQRSRIDRQPTAVMFWNECLRSRDENEDETEIVVGRAVAIRQYGRITAVVDGGKWLADEFGDLERLNVTEAEASGQSGMAPASSANRLSRRLYQFDRTDLRYSLVSDTPEPKRPTLDYATCEPSDPQLPLYGYRVEQQGTASSWKVGDAYGFEFASIELPHNFVFGSGLSYSTTATEPITGDPKIFFFSPFETSGAQIDIRALRPGSSGRLEAVAIGKTDSPSQNPN